MRRVRKEILKFLYDSRLELTPANIARNIGYDKNYVRQECAELANQGYLEKDDVGSNPYYSISEDGVKFVKNDDP